MSLSILDWFVPIKEQLPDAKQEGEDKCLHVQPTYSLSEIKAMKGMFASVNTPGKVYSFRLTRIASLTTSGSGGMNLVSLMIPSNFAQYAALVAIFLECRLVSTRVTINFLNSLLPTAFISAFDPNAVSGTTTTATHTSACVGSKVQSTQNFTRPFKNAWRMKGKSRRPWSSVAVSSPSTDPYSGVAGAWLHSVQNATSLTTVIADYLIEGEYEFRSPNLPV